MKKIKVLSVACGPAFEIQDAMGLFDYLTTPVAKAVLAKLYQLLKTGGQMFLQVKKYDN